MRLSTRARYGVRALMDIAQHGATGPVNLKEVAQRQGISEKYLEQVILSLKGAGMVRSVRGARGGFVLNRRPADIRLREIVEVLDGPIGLTDCVLNREVCPRSDLCAARDVWQEASAALREVLNSLTLEDLLQRQRAKTESREE
ncbi:MAG: RrF2 family transcriptional regulator [Desulfotomaculales bacterium]